jgi:hypothetical protein
MLVSVIGSTNLEKVAMLSGKSLQELLDIYASVGKRLAELGAELLVVPDEGIVEVAKAYRAAHGPKVIGLVPRLDKVWGIKHILPYIGYVDEEISDIVWVDIPYEIVARPDYVIMLSRSTGVFAELAFVKWLYEAGKWREKKKVICFQKLPKEIEYDIEPIIHYVKTVDEMGLQLF